MRNVLHLAVFVLSLALSSGLSAQEAGPEKHVLKLKLTKGQEFWFLNKLNMDNAIGMDAGAMEMGLGINIEMKMTVMELPETGGARLEVFFNRVWGTVESPMTGEQEFDSSETALEEDADMMMGAMRAVTGIADKKFTLELDARGRFVKAEGLDKVIRGGRGGMGMMGGGLSAQVIETQMRDLFYGLAAEPAAVGDSWDGAENLSAMGVTLPAKGKRVFEKLNADEFHVVFDGKIDSFNPDEAASDNPNMKQMLQSMKIEEASLRKIWQLSRHDGLSTRVETLTKVSAAMANPMDQSEMTIDNTTKSEIQRVKGPSKPKAESQPASQPAK